MFDGQNPEDRIAFANLAPEYYMLAFYVYFEYPLDFYTAEKLQKAFMIDADGEGYCYLENEAILKEAERILRDSNAITAIEDPFGPTLWQRGPAFASVLEQLEENPGSPFYKARKSGDRRSWLESALAKLNYHANQLSITEQDFAERGGPAKVEHDGPIDEWEPIQLDHADPTVVAAVAKLAEATEAIERDNGYSATFPQERDAVVQDLKGGLEKLQSGVVSRGWMRRLTGALRIVSARFANTMKGQMVDGALAAVKDVVKTHMSHLIEQLFSLWP